MNAKLDLKEILNVDVLSAKLEKSLEEEKNRQFLPIFLEEKLDALVTFMLTTVKISKARKVSLITQKGRRGIVALHIAARFSSYSSYKNLWNCIESFSNEAERTEILFTTDDHNMSVLHWALQEENLGAVNFLLTTAANLMDSKIFQKWLMQENNYKSNALHYASIFSAEAIAMLWKAAESKLLPEDQKKLLYAQDEWKHNVLQNAIAFDEAKCQKVIQSISRMTKKLFTNEEMRKFLLTEDIDGNTALHLAALNGNLEVFKILCSFIKELSKIDQKTLWKKNNSFDGSNIFTTSIKYKKLRMTQQLITKEIISAAKEILDPEEIWEAFTEKNRCNESFISEVTDFGLVDQIFEPEEMGRVTGEYMARSNSIKLILSKLSDALKDDPRAKDLKAALYAKVEDNDIALHFALQFGSNSIVDRIFQLVNIKLSTSERLELIQTKSLEIGNILWRSELNLHKGTLDIVCNFLIGQKDLVAGAKAIFIESISGNNFFQFAAKGNRSCLVSVLEWFKENFSHEDLRKVIFAHRIKSRILTHLVAHFCDDNLTKRFFDFCFASFGFLELKEIILDKSILYDTLYRSLRNPSSAVVSKVWNFYVKILNEMELEELLFKTDRGRTYFKYDQSRKNQEAVEALKALVTARYGEDKMLRLVP